MQGIAVAEETHATLLEILETLNGLGWSEHPPRIFLRKSGAWIVWSGAPEDWPERALALAAYRQPLFPQFVAAVRAGFDFLEAGDKLRVTRGRW